MSTDLATRDGDRDIAVAGIRGVQLSRAIESALASNDLSKLSVNDRIEWYNHRCRIAGLDPAARPFIYITLQGKLTLYATKECGELLNGKHGISHQILGQETVDGVRLVRVKATMASGRQTEDLGAIPVQGLKGADLANALMKTITKAKRRATLSLCGLGDMLDVSELDTVKYRECDGNGNVIATHHARHNNNASGHGSGAYADPETIKQFGGWCETFVSDVNAKWLDYHTDEGGLVTPGVKDLLSTWQVSGHLLKWAKAAGAINAPEDTRAGQRDKFTALVWQRDRDGSEAEAKRYGREKWREALAALKTEPSDVDDSDPDSWPEGRE